MAENLGYIVNSAKNTYYVTDSIKVDKLHSGCYAVDIDSNNSIFLKTVDIDPSNIILLPNSQLQNLLTENDNFWKESDKYKKFNLSHKRGFLLYGKPGSGKTTSIIKLCEHIVKMGGIVIFCDYFDDIVRQQITKIREVEPDRPIAIVFEQLDTIIPTDSGTFNTILLDFLDGIHGIDHVLFIASTNRLDMIPESIKKRPSRFDLKVEIKLPDEIDREFYFKEMIPAAFLKKIDLPTWIKDTEGYTVSHLKELITSYFIYGTKYASTITNINKLITNADKEIGFYVK